MEFVGAKLKPSMDYNEFAAVRDMFCKKPYVRDVNVAKGQKHMGWVRPAVYFWTLSAVDLELAAIPITEKVMNAVGGAWHMTSLSSLHWIAMSGLLPGGPRRRRQNVHFSPFPPSDPRCTSNFHQPVCS